MRVRTIVTAVAILLAVSMPGAADDAADLAAAQAAFGAGDYAKMLPLIQGLANRGNGEGMRALAVVYLRGQGVAKDEAKGLEWMTKAATAGLPAAQHELGLLYLNGVGAEKNLDNAALWLRKAADQGIGLSWHALGRMAADAKKPDEAADLYAKASELGVVAAMLDLAQSHMTKGAAATEKRAALDAYTEAYRWVQTTLTAVPSGPQRDEVHRIRLAIEDEIKKRDASGAATTFAAAKVDGEAKAKELRGKAEAQQADLDARAKAANAPPKAP